MIKFLSITTALFSMALLGLKKKKMSVYGTIYTWVDTESSEKGKW